MIGKIAAAVFLIVAAGAIAQVATRVTTTRLQVQPASEDAAAPNGVNVRLTTSSRALGWFCENTTTTPVYVVGGSTKSIDGGTAFCATNCTSKIYNCQPCTGQSAWFKLASREDAGVKINCSEFIQ